jgi:hypothetical protein
MKRSSIVFTLVGLFLAAGQFAASQSFETKSAAIVLAFNNRNATVLSEHFCNKIELVIPGYDNTFPKLQARALIGDFFARVQPKSFEILHQGSRANASFIIGNLMTASNTYRVNMLFKKEGNDLLIYQLRIE